jgi:hypothetical protein
MCPGCGRQIQVEYNVCPHCGRPQNLQYGPQPMQQQVEPLGGGITILLYLLSFFIPIVGIIIGLIWMGAGVDAERRRVGKMCLMLGILSIILWIVIGVIIALFVTVSML